jgi:glutamine synthetase
MLFTIPAESHTKEEITALLRNHPEVMFVSLMGVDIGGHDTDEKIPVGLFIEDMDQFFSQGVQTDGSSVVLPKIAALNNAKVDIIPDMDVNWYVDYNFLNIDADSLYAASQRYGRGGIPIHTEADNRAVSKGAFEASQRASLCF